MSITIPARASNVSAALGHPQYVSVNTQSATIAVNGTTPVVIDLAAGSLNCTPQSSAGRTCTIAVSAPTGADTFVENTYATTTGTGTPLSQNTTRATIVAGQPNTVKLVLDGVVASISLALANATPSEGAVATIPLTVTVLDSSNAAIIGSDPFANPISLTDTDTSGATNLSNATLNSPSDAGAVSVAYNGAAIPPAVFSASATGIAAGSIAPATLTPTASNSTAFVDWPTYAYDSQRSGFNPTTTGITPQSIASIHIAWQKTIGGSQSQPLIATNTAGHSALLIVAEYGGAAAFDAFTGAQVWIHSLPVQPGQSCGAAGTSGTPVYDRALNAVFVVAGNGSSTTNIPTMYKLDAATGATIGTPVDLTPTLEPGEANIAHSGLTLANGFVYAGTGSNCEGAPAPDLPSWRGRVVAVDAATMTQLKTFYPTWVPGSASTGYGGGGVWAWGGVSADAGGNIYVGTSNAETNNSTGTQTAQPPFLTTDSENIEYAEHLVKLSGDLSTVEGADAPTFNFANGGDLDYAGTPVVYQPSAVSGCGAPLTATIGKAGELVINNSSTMAENGTYNLSVPNSGAYNIGNAAYSTNTGYLYAAITSAAAPAMFPPGLIAIGNCGTSIIWNTQFGPDATLYPGEAPRSAPTVTAGGVVFLATPCTNSNPTTGSCGPVGALNGAVWAIDARTGAVLDGGKPVLITGDNIRMAPSADGLWVYVLDDSGNFTALTVDPAVQAVASKLGNHHVAPLFRYRGK